MPSLDLEKNKISMLYAISLLCVSNHGLLETWPFELPQRRKNRRPIGLAAMTKLGQRPKQYTQPSKRFFSVKEAMFVKMLSTAQVAFFTGFPMVCLVFRLDLGQQSYVIPQLGKLSVLGPAENTSAVVL